MQKNILKYVSFKLAAFQRMTQKLFAIHVAFTEHTLTLLSQNCDALRVLNIAGITSVTDSSLLMLSLRLKQLEDLDVSWNCSKLTKPWRAKSNFLTMYSTRNSVNKCL